MSLLSVEGLDLYHGLLRAVRDFSIEIAEGDTLAIVGANGAGKTTLLRAIAGAHPTAAGKILFDGRDVTREPAYKRASVGIALAPEGRRLFPLMSVEENLLLARNAGRGGRWTIDAVMEAFPNLKKRRKALAGSLSGGEQQATAIGRALMTNPSLLMLDEVSLGLSPLAVDLVYASLESLRADGTTMVVVEQDLTRAMQFAGHVVCMLEGQIALAGPSSTLRREQVTRAYFGLAPAGHGGVA